MIRVVFTAVLALGLLAGCGESTPPTAEELYEQKFEEGFTSIDVCQGLSRGDVRAMHKRRNEGIEGQILVADEMSAMGCDYRIRLFAEGKEEYRGL